MRRKLAVFGLLLAAACKDGPTLPSLPNPPDVQPPATTPPPRPTPTATPKPGSNPTPAASPGATPAPSVTPTLSPTPGSTATPTPTPTPVLTPTPTPPPAGSVVLNEDLRGRQVFPSSNWWNRVVSGAPLDPGSAAYIAWFGGRRLHPDFGPPPYGIPYVTVSGYQPLLPVTFTLYGSESDAGAPGRPPGYPIPDQARTLPNHIEGGVPGGGSSGDRHLLVIDRDQWLLFETWLTRWNPGAAVWEAGSGAVFDLARNDRRPEGWTSSDAAGLAVFPGLVRYDEAYLAGSINHALRVTTRATNGHVYPASHTAGATPGAPPMGMRLRLKASKDISGFAPPLQAIFQAMKTHGLIVADNGSDMYVTGTMDARWDNGVLNPAFAALDADDFEVVLLGWN